MGLALKSAAAKCAQSFTVEFEGGSENIWIKTPSQPDLDSISEKIAERRVEIRKKYLPGCALYEDATYSLALMTPEALATLILSERKDDIEERVRASVSKPITPDWSKYRTAPSLEAAKAANEERQTAYLAEVESKTNQSLADEVAIQTARPKEDLVSEASAPYLRELLREATTSLFNDYYIFFSVFDEDKITPYFETVEEVTGLSDNAKFMLLRAIQELPSLSSVDIKNSQGKSVAPRGLAENTPAVTADPSTTDSQESDSPKKTSRGGRKTSLKD